MSCPSYFLNHKPVGDLNVLLFYNLQFTLLLKIKYFHIKLLFCLFTYYQSLHNICNLQVEISITVSSPERLYVEYTRIPFLVYLFVISLVVSLPIRRGPGVFMNVLVRENLAFKI